MYSYTKYRALNDSIKICNSTDYFVMNIWRLRNEWVMKGRHSKNCTKRWILYILNYIVNKQFTFYHPGRSQYLTKHDYDVRDSKPVVCDEKFKPKSYHYTQEDLLMCCDSIISIKYDDEHKVWNNFSILYKKKMYSYTEYRALNDGIKICNSTDSFVKNTWKLRNNWVIAKNNSRSCKITLHIKKPFYIVNKQFIVYYPGSTQYLTRHDYDVRVGEPVVCDEMLRPNSYDFTLN